MTTVDDDKRLLWALISFDRERFAKYSVSDMDAIEHEFAAILNEWGESVGLKNVSFFVSVSTVVGDLSKLIDE